MPIDEIEIPGSSITFRVFRCTHSFPSLVELAQKAHDDGDQFNVAQETAGFHNIEATAGVLRGNYSVVIPFEVERLDAGLMGKQVCKRIETCEFWVLGSWLLAYGKSSPMKPLTHSLSLITGYGITAMEWEFHHLSQFHDRLSQVKSIAFTNPKDREIRRARLTGRIESYTEYNIIDPRNHGIDSVSGMVDSPLGPMTITVGRKGTLRLGVRRGFILTAGCLAWVLSMIADSQPPAMQKEEA